MLRRTVISFLVVRNRAFSLRCKIASAASIRMSSGKDLSDMRAPYHYKEMFDEGDFVSREPIGQFRAWFDEACSTDGVVEPNAMALATADRSGRPSVRMVLLKGYGADGFKFFTNYDSRKGTDLKENPRCSLMFYWAPLKKQVRIEGSVERLSPEESNVYFQQRPRPSQIGAAISRQSQPVANRQVLVDLFDRMEHDYPGEKSIPKPENWGGFLVRPSMVEFWQGQTNRVHDRFVFRKPDEGEVTDPSVTKPGEDGWVIERLCP